MVTKKLLVFFSDFTCNNGEKIPIEYFCDGNFDCSDQSDEEKILSKIFRIKEKVT